uniref:BTB domain-containing protein n=1 Tax=Rhabditophanes sp. KR3021 TaxID=114890 RepID=A0AC35TNX2_9BILA
MATNFIKKIIRKSKSRSKSPQTRNQSKDKYVMHQGHYSKEPMLMNTFFDVPTTDPYYLNQIQHQSRARIRNNKEKNNYPQVMSHPNNCYDHNFSTPQMDRFYSRSPPQHFSTPASPQSSRYKLDQPYSPHLNPRSNHYLSPSQIYNDNDGCYHQSNLFGDPAALRYSSQSKMNINNDLYETLSPSPTKLTPFTPFFEDTLSKTSKRGSKSPSKKSNEKSNERSKEKSHEKSTEGGSNSHGKKISKTFDYLSPQCKRDGCSATIFVENTKFSVCKQQLSHASDFFRNLFVDNKALPMDGVKQHSINECSIVVSGLSHPSQSIQFQWFIESIIELPVLRELSEETLETCMRLSKRFGAKGLENRCIKYIVENADLKPPMVALCWLNWIVKHRFDQCSYDACLPVVGRLSLENLEKHRQMLSERIYSDLLAAKLRTMYSQVVDIFKKIHELDHFSTDVRQCPRCGRTKEGGMIKIKASPCTKTVGCNICFKENECELEKKSNGDFQAYYKCEHALVPFNEKTQDCFCQSYLYKENFIKKPSKCASDIEKAKATTKQKQINQDSHDSE